MNDKEKMAKKVIEEYGENYEIYTFRTRKLKDPVFILKCKPGSIPFFDMRRVEKDRPFMIKAGASIYKKDTKHMKDENNSAYRLREKCLFSGALIDKGNFYRTTEDIYFKSSSGALSFILGCRVGPKNILYNVVNGKYLIT